MKRLRGFTLVEVLVVIAIIAILAAIAMPAMRGVIANGQIRAVSESWNNGLSLARAEAVRLNTLVQFIESPSGWVVQRVDDGVTIHQGSGKEGTPGLALTVTPGGATTVTFDSFGRVVNPNPADGSAPISQLDVASANPTGLDNYKPLRIQVLASGLSRLCNPTAPSTSPSACL